METPKTIKGFITLLTKIEETHLTNLKGFDKLTISKQESIGQILAEIGNILNDTSE